MKTTILLVFVLLIELRIFIKGRSRIGVENDRGSLKLVLGGVVLSIAAFFLFGFSKIGRMGAGTGNFGLCLVAAGFFLRQWAIWTLGRFFTPVVSSETHHKIIAVGPYRFLRHPSYTGLVLEFAGAMLAISNIAALIATLATMIPALAIRIRIEEEFLTKKFGNAYSAFLKKTPRIFP